MPTAVEITLILPHKVCLCRGKRARGALWPPLPCRPPVSGAIEKQKLVYILNRDAAARLTISSPLEAHKANTLVYHVVGVDVGFENPMFACLEMDYEVRSTRLPFAVPCALFLFALSLLRVKAGSAACLCCPREFLSRAHLLLVPPVRTGILFCLSASAQGLAVQLQMCAFAFSGSFL